MNVILSTILTWIIARLKDQTVQDLIINATKSLAARTSNNIDDKVVNVVAGVVDVYRDATTTNTVTSKVSSVLEDVKSTINLVK